MDETRDLVVALGKALLSGLNWASRRSFHGRKATYLAAAVTQLHFHIDSAQRDLHPLTAGDGDPINNWGTTVGVARKTATPARKAAAARVRGDVAASFTALSSEAQLQHPPSGLLFQITSNVTIPGSGFVDADIAAVSTGSETRLEAGEVLKFTAGHPDIETEVVLQLDLDEDGFDEEQFGSYRARVIATFAETPSGGNQNDFVKWALEALNTVATAYAYPNRAGRGTIDVVAFYAASGSARSLTSDDRDTVKAYIQTVAPFHIAGEGGGLRVLSTVADPQAVEILLTTNGQAAHAFHWDDSGGPEVLSWNGATRELQFDDDLPPSLRAGHTLIFKGVATAQDGREFKIESISDTDKVILERAPSVAPAATDLIFSGGPLTTPVRDAVVAHLNGETVYAGRGLTPLAASAVASPIGLDILADGMGPANPAGVYGTWSGAILRATLAKIATYKAGVRNVSIVSPASDYEAEDDAFPLDDQIHFVTPSSVIVRKA